MARTLRAARARRNTIGIYGHLLTSEFEVTSGEWCNIEDKKHEAELAAVKAEKATPGSREDAERVEACWRQRSISAEWCVENGYRIAPFGLNITKPKPEPQPERMRW